MMSVCVHASVYRPNQQNTKPELSTETNTSIQILAVA